MKIYNWQEQIREDELREIKNTLANGGTVIFPTETVYGIGANALDEKAIDSIYRIKKRPRDKAINIMVKSPSEIEKYAIITSDIEKKIIDNFMPGALTLILKRKDEFDGSFTKDDKTIGIRIPDHRITMAILQEIDFPLIVPSANISGKDSSTQLSDIIDDFKDAVDIMIDGGRILSGMPSTIVKVENKQIIILREGKITLEEIKKKIGVEN